MEEKKGMEGRWLGSMVSKDGSGVGEDDVHRWTSKKKCYGEHGASSTNIRRCITAFANIYFYQRNVTHEILS